MRCLIVLLFLVSGVISNVVCADSDYSDVLVSLEKVWLQQKNLRGRVHNLTEGLKEQII